MLNIRLWNESLFTTINKVMLNKSSHFSERYFNDMTSERESYKNRQYFWSREKRKSGLFSQLKKPLNDRYPSVHYIRHKSASVNSSPIWASLKATSDARRERGESFELPDVISPVLRHVGDCNCTFENSTFHHFETRL